MNVYVLVNLAILVPPLALSFDRKVAFHTNWRSLTAAVLIVSPVYIVWDIIVTGRGHWGFTPQYAGPGVLMDLPLGEILFFLAVPYASIFVYEVVRAYVKPKRLFSSVASIAISSAAAVVFLLLGILFSGTAYTMLAFFSVALFFLVALVTDRAMLTELHTWLYFAVSYITFLVVNGILTGLPIVVYGEAATTGIRVATIPIEDFFYNFGLLGFYLLAFRLATRRRRHA
jgi:lycopene cyclase domain-containing protein